MLLQQGMAPQTYKASPSSTYPIHTSMNKHHLIHQNAHDCVHVTRRNAEGDLDARQQGARAWITAWKVDTPIHRLIVQLVWQLNFQLFPSGSCGSAKP